jgi:hypothetical protein
MQSFISFLWSPNTGKKQKCCSDRDERSLSPSVEDCSQQIRYALQKNHSDIRFEFVEESERNLMKRREASSECKI